MILYSNDCPKCRVLKVKLDETGIDYQINTNIQLMRKKGFRSLPVLEINDRYLDFMEAVNYLRGRATE